MSKQTEEIGLMEQTSCITKKTSKIVCKRLAMSKTG